MRRLAKKVVVTARCFNATLDLLRPLCAVVSNASVEPWSRAELIERAHDAHALLCFMTDTVDAKLLDACPNLSLVACALKGFDNFDVAECARRGVAVTAVPDLLTAPTAELAVLPEAAPLARRMLRHAPTARPSAAEVREAALAMVARTRPPPSGEAQ